MADLKWLERYTGESTDELISYEHKYRIDSIILAFEQAIYQKAAREGDDALSEAERVVLAVESLEREVNNGGYGQFFINTPEYAGVILGALRAIGCNATAEITQRAVDTLHPARESEAGSIASVMAEENPVRDVALGECDNKYFDAPDSIEGGLFEYIKQSKYSIVLQKI